MPQEEQRAPKAPGGPMVDEFSWAAPGATGARGATNGEGVPGQVCSGHRWRLRGVPHRDAGDQAVEADKMGPRLPGDAADAEAAEGRPGEGPARGSPRDHP